MPRCAGPLKTFSPKIACYGAENTLMGALKFPAIGRNLRRDRFTQSGCTTILGCTSQNHRPVSGVWYPLDSRRPANPSRGIGIRQSSHTIRQTSATARPPRDARIAAVHRPARQSWRDAGCDPCRARQRW